MLRFDHNEYLSAFNKIILRSSGQLWELQNDKIKYSLHTSLIVSSMGIRLGNTLYSICKEEGDKNLSPRDPIII